MTVLFAGLDVLVRKLLGRANAEPLPKAPPRTPYRSMKAALGAKGTGETGATGGAGAVEEFLYFEHWLPVTSSNVARAYAPSLVRSTRLESRPTSDHSFGVQLLADQAAFILDATQYGFFVYVCQNFN